MAEAEEEERKRAASADEESRVKVVKRVPKGTSEYQAAWIMDDDKGKKDDDKDDEEEEEEDEEEDDDGDEEMSDFEKRQYITAGMIGEFLRSDDEWEDVEDGDDDSEKAGGGDDDGDDDDEEYEEISVGTDKDAKYDEGMDEDEERANLEKLRKDKKTQVGRQFGVSSCCFGEGR